MRKPYPSDLSEEQWAIIRPLIPVSKVGRPRTVEMREVFNAILYLNRTGCQWDMLPHDFLPKSTVYDYFAQWRDDGTWHSSSMPCGSRSVSPTTACRRPVPAASTARR